MLQINNLSIYHTKDLTPLVQNLSFTLRSAERMALIGEEGNGKSTLLRLIAGDKNTLRYVSTQGTITLTDPAGYLPQELPFEDREKSAYSFFCESPFFFDTTPRELGEIASRFVLPADIFYSEQRMCDFSGGERVKLQLARILIGRPGVLLLDEPSNDLDLATVRWLCNFLVSCTLPVLFVSHDETLLRRAATSVLLLERLRRRQTPRSGVHRMDYDTFVKTRADLFARQERIARKEREEFKARMERYNQIRQRVDHEQNAVSRGDPHSARMLKKKMHAVTSMGRRFEREQENMTDMPEAEEAIFARLDCTPLPPSKVVLDLDLDHLDIQGRVISRNLRLCVRAEDKLLISGRNGTGKSTLLRLIRDRLSARVDIVSFYMPQEPGDLLDLDKTPEQMLRITGDKEESIRNCVALGSMKFTAEEMHHPCRALSGGQKAKLMFLMMANAQANVLLLDEPTRNLSPLSGPVIRELFESYPGCIIAVSHDEAFARQVCTRYVELTENGLTQFDEL